MAATVSEIRSAVQDLWSFFVPPIGRIMVALLILVLIGGSGLLSEVFLGISALLNQVDQAALMMVLEKFSLTPLVPVIGLFIFGFIIFAVDRLLKLLPSAIPVSFVQSDSALYGLHRKLGEIWRFAPEAENISQVFSILEHQLAAERLKDEKAALSNVDSWMESSDRCFRQQEFVRFLIVWIFVASIIVALVGRDSLRVSVVIGLQILCVAVLLWTFLRTAEIHDQIASAKIDAFAAIALNQGRKPLDPSDERWLEIQPYLDSAEKEAKKGWWWVSLFSFRWLKMARYRRRRRLAAGLVKKMFGKSTPNPSATPDVNRASRGRHR
jgi:hypothetical protein